MTKAVVTTHLHVQAKKINKKVLEKHYRHHFFKDNGCSKCEHVSYRPTTECQICPNYEGSLRLWKEKTVQGVEYIALPPGRPEKIEKLFKLKLKIEDRRKVLKLKDKIKFKRKLFTGEIVNGRKTVNQQELAELWLEKKNGIIIAPPRAGKTILGTYLTTKLNVKTLIVAHQKDFLRQFLATFIGSKSKKAFTDINKKSIGIVKKPEDLLKYDIALMTYQSFIREKTSLLRISKFLRNKFSFLIVDELHRAASPRFSEFISRLDCKYRLGLTATLNRKDSKDVLLPDYFGPVVGTAKVSSLIPQIILTETGVYSKYNYNNWVSAMRFLSKHEKRTEMILKQIEKDYKKGHKCIIIPVDYKEHAFRLKNLVNDMAAANGWTEFEPFADVFHANCDREKIIKKADSGKLPVLIAIRSMITMGIDMATPSMIYIVVPMSANSGAGAPMFYQLSHRVASWAENKKPPVIRLFLDGIGQSYGCFKSLFWKEIFPNLEGRSKEPRYKMSDITLKRAMMLGALKTKYFPVNQPGERITSKQILKQEGIPLNYTKTKAVSPVKKAF